jgi:hypothetical protein
MIMQELWQVNVTNCKKYEKALFILRLRNRRYWKHKRLRNMLEDAQKKQKKGAVSVIIHNQKKTKAKYGVRSDDA